MKLSVRPESSGYLSLMDHIITSRCVTPTAISLNNVRGGYSAPPAELLLVWRPAWWSHDRQRLVAGSSLVQDVVLLCTRTVLRHPFVVSLVPNLGCRQLLADCSVLYVAVKLCKMPVQRHMSVVLLVLNPECRQLLAGLFSTPCSGANMHNACAEAVMCPVEPSPVIWRRM